MKLNSATFMALSAFAIAHLAQASDRYESYNWSPAQSYGTRNSSPAQSYGTRNSSPAPSYGTRHSSPAPSYGTRHSSPAPSQGYRGSSSSHTSPEASPNYYGDGTPAHSPNMRGSSPGEGPSGYQYNPYNQYNVPASSPSHHSEYSSHNSAPPSWNGSPEHHHSEAEEEHNDDNEPEEEEGEGQAWQNQVASPLRPHEGFDYYSSPEFSQKSGSTQASSTRANHRKVYQADSQGNYYETSSDSSHGSQGSPPYEVGSRGTLGKMFRASRP